MLAHTDVNGDGHPDAVGMARRGENGAARGTVIIRVKTGPHRVTTARQATEYWYGPLWQGVAFLDGHKGKEIVVGRITGAHARGFQALTWRHGDLVTLGAPGRGRY